MAGFSCNEEKLSAKDWPYSQEREQNPYAWYRVASTIVYSAIARASIRPHSSGA
jgi:hypothetical protein